MVYEENLVIIVMLDYGLIIIKYFLNFVEGRYEIYDLIFFMIIFKGVVLKFGVE